MKSNREITLHYIETHQRFINAEIKRLGDKTATRPVQWKLTDKGLSDKMNQFNANLEQFEALAKQINDNDNEESEVSVAELMNLENAMMACANVASHRRQESRNKFINGATTALSLGIVRLFKPNGIYGLSESMTEYMKLGPTLKNFPIQKASEQKSDASASDASASAASGESKAVGVAPLKKDMFQLRLENVYDVSIQSPVGRHAIVESKEDGLKVAEDYNQFRTLSKAAAPKA